MDGGKFTCKETAKGALESGESDDGENVKTGGKKVSQGNMKQCRNN